MPTDEPRRDGGAVAAWPIRNLGRGHYVFCDFAGGPGADHGRGPVSGRVLPQVNKLAGAPGGRSQVTNLFSGYKRRPGRLPAELLCWNFPADFGHAGWRWGPAPFLKNSSIRPTLRGPF